MQALWNPIYRDTNEVNQNRLMLAVQSVYEATVATEALHTDRKPEFHVLCESIIVGFENIMGESDVTRK